MQNSYPQLYHTKILALFWEVEKKVVGQQKLIRDLLIALFSNGHILIEWAPWLAKTLSVDSLARALQLDFKRIQFTPDLLPSDLIGSNIYHPETNEFAVRKGPIFSNFVLADEINRAPSKVQSALLEAMAEKQVSIADATYKLSAPFIVLATQNPIEQEGTYHLPEAQLDRFLLKTLVSYPTESEELEIMRQYLSRQSAEIYPVMDASDIAMIQNHINEIAVGDMILEYIKNIVFYTRKSQSLISHFLAYPVSPRASLWLLQSTKTLAFLSGRDFVLPEDVKEMAYPVLRHRAILNYEALASNVSPDEIISILLDNVLVP